jgi:hypothetical protein
MLHIHMAEQVLESALRWSVQLRSV